MVVKTIEYYFADVAICLFSFLSTLPTFAIGVFHVDLLLGHRHT